MGQQRPDRVRIKESQTDKGEKAGAFRPVRIL
jgi:hypothetical protein